MVMQLRYVSEDAGSYIVSVEGMGKLSSPLPGSSIVEYWPTNPEVQRSHIHEGWRSNQSVGHFK